MELYNVIREDPILPIPSLPPPSLVLLRPVPEPRAGPHANHRPRTGYGVPAVIEVLAQHSAHATRGTVSATPASSVDRLLHDAANTMSRWLSAGQGASQGGQGAVARIVRAPGGEAPYLAAGINDARRPAAPPAAGPPALARACMDDTAIRMSKAA